MGKTIPICCGVDVHKKFLVATILTGDYLIPQCKQKHFGISFRNLLAFKQWLLDNNCKDVCMESTGKYWVPVWNLLQSSPLRGLFAIRFFGWWACSTCKKCFHTNPSKLSKMHFQNSRVFQVAVFLLMYPYIANTPYG